MKSAAIAFLMTIALALGACVLLVYANAVAAAEAEDNVKVEVTMPRATAEKCVKYGCKSMSKAELNEIYQNGYEAGQKSVDEFLQVDCRRDDA